MKYKCDKCGKKFETKKEAEKHEENCRGKRKFNLIGKLNLIEQAESMLEKNERVLKRVIIQAIVKSISTIIYLTNKRIIYWKTGFMGNKFDSIYLSEIESVMFFPVPLGSAGRIKILTKNNKNLLISPSNIGQIEANEFIKEVRKRIK